MFTIIIKNLEVYLSNSNLLRGKVAICFKLLALQWIFGKQITAALYYKYSEFILQEHMLFGKNLGQKLPFTTRSIVLIFRKQDIKHAIGRE